MFSGFSRLHVANFLFGEIAIKTHIIHVGNRDLFKA